MAFSQATIPKRNFECPWYSSPFEFLLVTLNVSIKSQKTGSQKIAQIFDRSFNLVNQGVSVDGESISINVDKSSVENKTFMLVVRDFEESQQQGYLQDTFVVNGDMSLEIDIGGGGGEQPITGDAGRFTDKVEMQIDGSSQPVARTIVAIEEHASRGWYIAGSAESDKQTGNYSLDVITQQGNMYLFALDDFGEVFINSAAIALGDTIRPSTFSGIVYRCVQAGTLSEKEPEWWIDTTGSHTKQIGTALLRAFPYYRPLGHGPVKAEIIEP
ncbi:hypothetical protein [Parendozoicomonas sp. Alg238-R29]|uniref:hypothetical protein n=1 Tax=Parendozoicomonas sp. Alg238-R29 TaxID=2993446 RepID=UPI00248E0A83|nr:hypothetical protein [Parendozoicomonas sp. Alg238-R29]